MVHDFSQSCRYCVQYLLEVTKESLSLLCRTLSQWRFRSCQGRLCTYPHRVHLFCAVSQRSFMEFCFLSFWPPRMWAPSTATLPPADCLLGPLASALVCFYFIQQIIYVWLKCRYRWIQVNWDIFSVISLARSVPVYLDSPYFLMLS